MARNKRNSHKAQRAPPKERNLPDWYYRVSALVTRREFESQSWSYSTGPHGSDFDEDISEINSEGDHSCHCYSDVSECECVCECSSDVSECECECSCSTRDDVECYCEPESEADFASDEEDFPDYKAMREERKEEIAEERKSIERAIKYQKTQEEEVEKALTKAADRKMQGKDGQRLKLKSCHFNIYSSEYMRSLPLFQDQGTMYIEFYPICDFDDSSDDTRFVGHFYFNSSISPSIAPFEAPKRADLSGMELKLLDKDASITVTFFDRYHLKLAIPRHIVFDQPLQADNSQSMEFYGINTHELKEKAKRKQKEEKEEKKTMTTTTKMTTQKPENEKAEEGKTKRKREEEEEAKENKRHRREVSPKESWFEMNHPAGWWARSHGWLDGYGW